MNEEFLQNYMGMLRNTSGNLLASAIEVAGCAIEIQAEQAHLEALEFHLGHLTSEKVADATLKFLEFSQAVAFPFKLTKDFESFGTLWIRYLPSFDIVVLADSASSEYFILFRQSRRPESADVLRLLLQLLIKTSAVPIHGGSIGWGGKSALISNVGGSGKSSLISAAVAQGASTTGDDFGLLEIGDGMVRIWSQFRSFKVAPDSPSFSLSGEAGIRTPDLKRSFSFEWISQGRVSSFQDVDVILIPKLGSDFRIARTSSEFAFSRIAPSSAGMAIERQRTNLAILELCERIPAFELELTRNLAEEVKAIREFLSS